MRKITSLILILVVVLVGLLPQAVASAADEGTTSGAFTISNAAPSVSAVEVYSESGLINVVTSLTPQVMYFTKVTVSDANTLDDITHITLKIFYDSDNSTADDESLITTGNTQTAANITWTKSGNTYAIDAGGGTTWTVVSANSTTPTMTDSTGDWVIAFKVGKVATESLGSAKWVFHARAFDSVTSSGLYNRNNNVLWYGQIAVNTGSVDFGSVTPGTGFADNLNEQGSISKTFVVNGAYQEKVKSTANWTGVSNNATLDDTGAATSPKQFSLKAWDSDTFGSAALVDSTGVALGSAGLQTAEGGSTNATNTLWLKLAPVFPVDVYSGTITYIVAIHP